MRILLILIILTSSDLFAQQEQNEISDVSIAELTMRKYSKDTSAAAVILMDRGTVKVNTNSTVGTLFKRHLRVKIFKKSLAEDWVNMEFLVEKNDVSKLVATTYNFSDGKIQKSEIQNAKIYKKEFSKGVQKISFAFPNVMDGSVIDLAYTIKCEGAYLPSWQFQYLIPVMRSEYILIGPSKIVPHFRGSIPLSNQTTKFNGSYNEWLMTDIPAFKYEPMMPDKNAYIASIEFVYNSSWEDVYLHFRGHQNSLKIVTGDKSITAKVGEITEGVTDPLQKIKVISGFIKRTVTWNGICDYLADPLSEVLEKKTGTVGDINLLFASMLKKAGFQVDLVLLSTRDHGFIQQGYPSIRQFNYVICQVMVDNKELFFDATEKLLPFDMLPGRCFNHKGFLVSDKQYGWIGIEPIRRHKVISTANLVLKEDGSLTGEISLAKEGYAAFDSRKGKTQNEIIKDRELKDIVGSRHSDLKSISVTNADEIDKTLDEKYEVGVEEYATQSDNFMYLNPYVFLREESNPFVLASREYPIDFDMLTDKVSVCKITLPENYIVQDLPKSKTFTLPDNAGKCSLSITQKDNQLLAVSRLQINKLLFMPDEYPNLKEFYALIVSKMTEVVVLRKKT